MGRQTHCEQSLILESLNPAPDLPVAGWPGHPSGPTAVVAPWAATCPPYVDDGIHFLLGHQAVELKPLLVKIHNEHEDLLQPIAIQTK